MSKRALSILTTWRSVLLTASLLVTGFTACSADDSAAGGRAGAGGGSSGASGKSAGGTSGALPDASSDAAADSGSGGSAGQNGACRSCASGNCTDVSARCLASPGCKTWSDCVATCGDTNCFSQCDRQHQDAYLLYYDVYACLCQSCTMDCAAAQACDKKCVDDAKLPPLSAAPQKLSETGLPSGNDGGLGQVKSYRPAHQLWSDGAAKQRWAYIPKCEKIETSNMDHWKLPVGTRFWKEFTRNNAAGQPVRIETRLIHRFGAGDDDWIFAAYQWPVAMEGGMPTDANLVTAGVPNANGTNHDIPSPAACKNCHGRLVEKILSFSAIQLSHSESGETIASLSNAGRLTVPKPEGFAVPGSDVAKAALGYLHANCGNCHNDSSVDASEMRLRLLVNQTTVETTSAYTTAVGKPTTLFNCLGAGIGTCNRIEPGRSIDSGAAADGGTARSAVHMRMSSRAAGVQMPPIATEVVDTAGLQAVTAWINTLP